MSNSLSRFSNRVQDYIKYRPSYPAAALDFILGQTKGSVHVADIGAGTGISSNLLARHKKVARVFAVEPNDEMREAIDGNVNVTAHAGTASQTLLPDNSVDICTAFQAFHWFKDETPLLQTEWRRILRPPESSKFNVFLVWNDRIVDDGGHFLSQYEALILRHGTDYAKVNHQNVSGQDKAAFDTLFGPNRWVQANFENKQTFNFEGLSGRLASSSYVPSRGTPEFAAMDAELRELFDKFKSENGTVDVLYDTKVFAGSL